MRKKMWFFYFIIFSDRARYVFRFLIRYFNCFTHEHDRVGVTKLLTDVSVLIVS